LEGVILGRIAGVGGGEVVWKARESLRECVGVNVETSGEVKVIRSEEAKNQKLEKVLPEETRSQA